MKSPSVMMSMGELAELLKAASAVPEMRKQLSEMQRRLEALHNLYSQVLQKLAELD